MSAMKKRPGPGQEESGGERGTTGMDPARWHALNQTLLSGELACIREAIAGYMRRNGLSVPPPRSPAPDPVTLEEARAALRTPTALDLLCAGFGMTRFERDLVLLCAALDLDPSFPALCAAALGDPRKACPTPGLALAALPDAHWSAFLPDAPLRRWHMIEVGPGDALTLSPLRLDERILHHLLGLSPVDARLESRLVALEPPGALPSSHQAVAERIADGWSGPESPARRPAWLLCAEDAPGAEGIAAESGRLLGLRIMALRADDLPEEAAGRELLMRLWEREAVLVPGALLLDCTGVDDAGLLHAASAFAERVESLLLISSRDPLHLRRRLYIRVDVRRPTTAEQRGLWQQALGPLTPRLNGQLEPLLAQFDLSTRLIRSVGAEVQGRHALSPEHPLDRLVWDACRVQARPGLEELAQRIDPRADWDDLVIPAEQRQILRELAMHVRQRTRVYDAWGFSGKSSRGLGIAALFAGASGTGKTMGAEVLARELELDLYRIDLSQVVSKYIGETEKNLRRVFDAAEQGGAILLFDEADALFGKRSEVKDSHDRYANVEVSYLLQRMEAYRGLAILTTNLKNALDSAFLRRLRFVVQFPFPDASHRSEIWRRLFPAATPTEGLDFTKLARLNVAGGNIRNIGLNAAFLAADEGSPVRMRHLLRAARAECQKLEKSITDAEILGWI